MRTRLGRVAILIPALATMIGGGRAEATQRNILMLIADDVGVDKIGAYVNYYNTNDRSHDDITVMGDIAGDSVDVTPTTTTVDSLAKCGVMFLNAWGCPTCSPSRASILTGTYPFDHHVYIPEESGAFSTSTMTIAELLSPDYASGLFGKWHLGPDVAMSDPVTNGPVQNGFSRHVGFSGGQTSDYRSWDEVISQSGAADRWTSLTRTDGHYTSSVFADSAAAWINRQTKPWLAWVAFNAAHSVLLPNGNHTLAHQEPPTGCGCHTVSDVTDDNDVFRATVECMDQKIRSLLSALPQATLEKTTIIFLGDNGTESARSAHFTGDHGKGSLYEGGMNLPLIIADGYAYLHHQASSSGTGRVVNPGRIDSSLVAAIDLFPTMAAIGAKTPTTSPNAVSLIPLLERTMTSVRSVNFAQTSDSSWAVRTADYKLIRSSAGYYELYTLDSDRWEKARSICIPAMEAILRKQMKVVCPTCTE